MALRLLATPVMDPLRFHAYQLAIFLRRSKPKKSPGTCQLAKLVDRTVTVQPSNGEPYTLKNGPPYPANTLTELHLDASSNVAGVWVEHQACQIPGTGPVPLRILPPAAHQCR